MLQAVLKFTFYFVLNLFIGTALAQDPQYSQYYSAPLLLNPAFTGSSDCYRIGLNARTQWPGLTRSFNTTSLFADLNYKSINSGIGFMLLHDNIGTARLSSNEFSGLYSYYVPLSKHFNLRFGLQATYASRNVDYSDLIFEDQFNDDLLIGGSTEDPIVDYNKNNYFDFSGGMVLFGEDYYWVGFSAHHLNRPEQAFYTGDSRLPIKYSIHGGYNIIFEKGFGFKRGEFLRLIPTFNYKSQAKFDQLDIGIYAIEHNILMGILYRGLIIKEYENIRNNDAITLHVGYNWTDLQIHYSYDLTTSRLGINNTLGSHEISLVYTFCNDWPPHKHNPGHKQRKLPCPDFRKRGSWGSPQHKQHNDEHHHNNTIHHPH